MGAKYVFNPLTGNLDTTDVVAFNGEVNLGTAAAPSVFFTGDSNTGIYSPGADQVAISTNGTGRLFIDASGNVGIGTASPGVALHVGGDIRCDGVYGETDTNTSIQFPGSDVITFNEGGSEAARIDSSGRLLVGTSSARTNFFNAAVAPKLQIEGTSTSNDGPYAVVVDNSNTANGPRWILGKSRSTGNTIVQSGDRIGELEYQGNDGTEFVSAANIECYVDGTPGANDMPGRLVFSTNPGSPATGPTEAMRITKDQAVCINRTGVVQTGNSLAVAGDGTNTVIGIQVTATSGSINALGFTDGSGQNCGEIVCDTSANTTSYSTTSDYRLKENVVPIANATQRLNQLRPYRFNFISAPSTTFDGFLAHEAQEVVPEAVNRIKDQVDENGNPEYQTIDQSKLVPLLTAALQEALAEIESLKARVTALEP